MSNEDTTKYIQGKLLQEHRRGLDAYYRTEIFTEHGVRVATVDLCPEDVPNGQVYLRGGTARRLVACVNACAGITTEQLERGGLEMPLLSTLADIRLALGVGDRPMLSELAPLVSTAVRHREMAIGALQNAIGMLTLYTSPTDELAQSGIQSLKDVLFQVNGGNG